MTLRMYAERKKLALRAVSVRLIHRRIHAKDCADCESTDGQIAEIERIIDLQGDLTPDERQRLLEIADKCPVHRTLAVTYTHLRAHETVLDLVCRLLLEKKNKTLSLVIRGCVPL